MCVMRMMIAPNSRPCKGGSMGEFEGYGVIQSAICCTMCIRGSVGLWHERFENSGSVLGRHPGLFVQVTQEAGVVP